VGSTTVYLRLAATTGFGTYSGNVSVVGGGATPQNVAIPSSTVAKKALTITGLSNAGTRVYDATTAGTVSGTPAYDGFVNGDSFPVTDTVTWTFANKNVGTAKPLGASGDFSAPSANYSVTQPTFAADITAASLTFTGGAVTSRAYAVGNTNVTITGSLSGVIGSDVVNFTGTGTIASANAGSSVPVTAAVSLSGTDSGNYNLTQPTGLTVNITKADQSITFGSLSNKQVGDAAFALSASANSGLTVSYSSSDTAVATVAGSTVTVVGVGTTTITASQAGDDNYNAATSVPQSLTVTPGPTTLAIGDIAILGFNSNTPDGFAFVTWVDLGPNTVIKFTDNAFLSSGSATGTNNGRGGENFVTWTNNTGNVIAAGTVITIVDGTPATTSQGSVSQRLTGISNSGDQIFAYQGVGAGTSTSNSDFGANANPSTFTGTILFGLNFGSDWLSTGVPSSNTSYRPSELAATYGSIALTTISTSRGQYTGARSGLTLAQLKAAVVDPTNWTTATGTGVITLDTTAFTIAQPQTITFAALEASTYGDSSFALSATANSTLAVTFTSSDPTVASVDGNTVTILKAGSTDIVASQAGGTANSITYAAATPVTNSLTVSPKALAVTAEAKSKVYGAGDPALTYTSSGLVGGDSLSGSLARTAGENVGTYAINQGTLANANYNISFIGANLEITAAALPAVSWGTATITNSNGVSGFSYLYTGRSSNGISTSYSNSVAPAAAGYYTAVATSTDGNYTGSSTNQFHVSGPVLANDTGASSYDLRKPQDNSMFFIDKAVVLANDKRIDSSGAVQTTGLDIASVTAVTGSISYSSPFIVYTPTSAATDTFTYSVTADGVTATATVTVVPETNADVPTFTLQIVRIATAPAFAEGNTTVTVDFIGVPGKSYEVLYKGDLNEASWTTTGSHNTGATGSFSVTVTKAGNHLADWASMFFQAKVNP
jgi:hypothetical protein